MKNRAKIGRLCCSDLRNTFRLALGVAWALALWAPATTAAPPEKKDTGVRRVYGFVTKVESNRITIMSLMGDAKTLPLTTQEDFREKVAKGSRVTAWYVDQGDAYALKWLEYPLENSFTSVRSIRSRVRRAVILANSNVPDIDPLYDATAEFLEANLRWRFASRGLAENIRQADSHTTSAAEVGNPSSGDGNPNRMGRDEAELIRLIAQQTKVNAVLEIDVEQVEANIKHSLAVWDGVEEPVSASTGLLVSAKPVIGQKDKIPAATVVFRLWDSRGKPVWTNRRGFALLALREGKELRERPLTQVFQNTDNVQAWLEMVFRSILPASSVFTAGRP